MLAKFCMRSALDQQATLRMWGELAERDQPGSLSFRPYPPTEVTVRRSKRMAGDHLALGLKLLALPGVDSEPAVPERKPAKTKAQKMDEWKSKRRRAAGAKYR